MSLKKHPERYLSLPYDEFVKAFSDKFTVNDNGCWLWLGSRIWHGYARICVGKGKYKAVHRIFYEKKFGPIDNSIELHHKCKVRHCINPDHLEAVSPTEHDILHNYGRILTSIQETKVIEYYIINNLTIKEVSVILGVSRVCIRGVLLRNNVKLRNVSWRSQSTRIAARQLIKELTLLNNQTT